MHGSFISGTRISKSWLFTPPLRGTWAIAASLVAIAVPVAFSLTLAPDINDQTCTIFCPFVLATTILCGWRYAIAVAVASAVGCNTVLMGVPYHFHVQWSEIEPLLVFLTYSAFVILVVQFFRLTAARSLRQAGARERMSGIVFSLDGGQAWASWYGVDAPVRLGPPDEVVEMMKDFIAQMELAKHFPVSSNDPLR
ncbi:hypothetical protein KRR38_08770 [Novosphingobium sp. G106]|uniref:DUF4118 domain-containing protein n=1 Tax=Novosphingobium sp. G106 TaxID=2849500 RepID=UPI001C2DC73E|nr:DUF4118 domain-containing protein [Novosphingobium sp. G106]MBV1687765.1 hypothetical protein [Novosphingobium sp. G106]